MEYQEAITYLTSYTDYEVVPRLAHNADNYDLRRVEELLSHIGNPHLKARSIHIAGTNGKGSVAVMVASVLAASGYIAGLYTSPHLHTWRERIRVNGKLISEEELTSLVEELRHKVELVNQKATYGRLTTFELLTALAFTYFHLKVADFQVLEVGLGGKFDATNVIIPEISVITSISFDHIEVLGKTLTDIASEKAGIIKPRGIVVTSPQLDEVTQVIEKTCIANGSRLIKVGSDVTWQDLGSKYDQQLIKVDGRLGHYKISLPLLGSYQLQNTATAVAVLEVLSEKGFNISMDSIITGLACVSWPGRLQIINRQPLIIADGAHNPDAAHRLCESLRQYFNYDQAILVFGSSDDKDISGVVNEFVSLFSQVIVTCSNHPRVRAPAAVLGEFTKRHMSAEIAVDVPMALDRAMTLAGEKDLVCVTGSLFIVAEAIETINRHNTG
ncbi:bifunctional folylpolyglutamate synthase/dihydrofolate synthase [Chloroflexota bacterium]